MLLSFYLLLMFALASKANPAPQSDAGVWNETKPRNSTNHGSKDPLKVGQKNIVCYYNSGSAKRKGMGRLEPDKVDPFMCTHLIYEAVTWEDEGHEIESGNGWVQNVLVSFNPDIDLEINGGYGGLRKFTNLKLANPKLKVLLSIGVPQLFYKYIAHDNNRRTFIKRVIDFVIKFNFDGIDMNWQYMIHKRNYVNLLQSLKLELESRGLLLSALVTKDRKQIERGYDIPNMVKHLDLINLMTFDYNVNWDSYTGLHAPLYSSSCYDRNENDSMLNVKWSVDHWISQGAPREKLNLGISTWGRTYRLAYHEVNGLWAPAQGLGHTFSRIYTKSTNSLSYAEICKDLSEVRYGKFKWTSVYLPEYEQPYAFGESEWVSYEDTKSVAMKAEYARRNGLGGVAILNVDTDDFAHQCFEGMFPLVKAAARELNKNEMSQEATGETPKAKTIDRPKNESCLV